MFLPVLVHVIFVCAILCDHSMVDKMNTRHYGLVIIQ